MNLSGSRALSATLVLSLGAAACANVAHQPAAPRLAPATPTPVPTPEPSPASPDRPALAAVPLPGDPAPSGTLLKVGWKSDLPEIVFGPPGQRWIVVSRERAQVLRGPLRFKPEGKRAFQVQAGAFSEEEPARQRVEKLAADFQTSGSVAFSAERGVYRVLLGSFPDRAAAEAFAERLRASGEEATIAPGSGVARTEPASVNVTSEEGEVRLLTAPVDLYPFDADARIPLDGKPYRGSLRVLVNPRGTVNVVTRVDLEEYLYGVVPAEMGPRRYDELEALKAQSVAARTYALAHLGQFETEGYDLCGTPKCQVYGGFSAEDPLSNAAVDATRGLVLAYDGRLANALFTSTCGGRTEDVENVFGEPRAPYLASVECGELETTDLPGRPVDRGAARFRTGLEWRGYVVQRQAPRRKGTRSAALETARGWAGIGGVGRPPATLSPAAVYPSILFSFDLAPARALHLRESQSDYYSETPPASGRLSGAAREAYDFLLRFRFGAGEPLPPGDRNVNDEEYAGLLFSVALRVAGVTEGSGKFLSREGSNVWVKTAEGRLGLPVDPDLPLARRVADGYTPAASLRLRAGDRLRWWKRGSRVLALWVELDAAGPTFERESAWTEWVRRVSGVELARRMAARVSGTEVREVLVTRRSESGRVVGARIVTDASEIALSRFEVRQALELPELAFTVQKARGAEGEPEFVFLGRGWGHGVGLCQNGAYGMALAGDSYDAILKHYYSGIDIVTSASLASGR